MSKNQSPNMISNKLKTTYKTFNILPAIPLLFFLIIKFSFPEFIPKHDLGYYFNALIEAITNFKPTVKSILSFNLAGHPSMAYFIYLATFQKLSLGNEYLLNFANGIIYFFAFGYMYKFLVDDLKLNPIFQFLILSSIFIFPLAIALSFLPCPDFSIYIFLIVLIVSHYRKNLYLYIFSGLFLCFSKEIGVFTYLFFTIGILFKDFFILNKFNLTKILFFIPVLIFLIYHFFLSHLNFSDMPGFHTIYFDKEYVYVKIGEIFISNFNWLISILIIIGLINIFKNGKFKIFFTEYFEIHLVFISALLFCFIYITWTHPRYNLYFQVLLCFYLAFLIRDGYLKPNKIVIYANFGLLAFSNFFSLDPITNYLFQLKSVDRYLVNLKINNLITMGQGFNDGTLYNLQYFYSDILYKQMINTYKIGPNDVILTSGDSANKWACKYELSIFDASVPWTGQTMYSTSLNKNSNRSFQYPVNPIPKVMIGFLDASALKNKTRIFELSPNWLPHYKKAILLNENRLDLVGDSTFSFLGYELPVKCYEVNQNK